MTTYTDPRSVFPAPSGAVLRLSMLGKPLTDTVTGFAIKTFGSTDQWTNVPCYMLATYGAWPVRDCEVVR